MKTFTDNAGRTWTVAVNVGAVKRVKDLTGVNLASAVFGDVVEKLAEDPVLLCDVLYALCKPEAEANGVTDEQFGQAMGGDAIDTATTALLEELVSFFPSRRRSVLQKVLDKHEHLEGVVLASAAKRLESDLLDRAVQKEMEKLDARLEEQIAGGSSGNSPASSESIPTP